MATRYPALPLLGALIVSGLLVLAGCDGDRDPDAHVEFDNHITGSVGDGPIVGARIRVFNRSGKLLMETQSSSSADYDVDIKAKGNEYALTVEADRGIDLVTGTPPDFRLLSAIVRPNQRSITNLNPFTTLIFGAAQKSGRINDSNVASASSAVVTRYGFGLDPHTISDPTNTEIDNSNIHVIVKTSETLGEMIRRTRDALYTSGSNLDGDGVMNALAADLTDGWIDGRGTKGADARVAAVANVASAAVLVQAMANRLHVNGVNATQAMDSAIRQVRPSAPSGNNTASVPIPAEAFAQVSRALHAASVVMDDPRIEQTIQAMQSAPPGSTPSAVASRLPSGIDGVLNDAVHRAATATPSQLAAINNAARSAPAAPASSVSISGSPTTALSIGTSWSFRPTASSETGGTLTFSVQGRPSWASFDSTTGRIRGTPQTAGSFGPITISVTDGSGHASLPAFTLHVAEYASGTATVSWIPPTQRTDGTALTNIANYKIYYGKSSTSLTHVVQIANPGQTSHVVENLDSGTWYFAVTATCGSGLESARSAVASKTI